MKFPTMVFEAVAFRLGMRTSSRVEHWDCYKRHLHQTNWSL